MLFYIHQDFATLAVAVSALQILALSRHHQVLHNNSLLHMPGNMASSSSTAKSFAPLKFDRALTDGESASASAPQQGQCRIKYADDCIKKCEVGSSSDDGIDAGDIIAKPGMKATSLAQCGEKTQLNGSALDANLPPLDPNRPIAKVTKRKCPPPPKTLPQANQASEGR
ncbi:hypothetical protein BDU57DRAFT_261384 [Ampelomyces quisqualis]|uniref:Uncharacterized protein n=1 Tax=Ampelomyces quisqualis TaxID=50730 RepID=A0A6A5QJQ4_AMPQU|nr:hypothetical protein BDU57DRAFT_261384 [Ampelomyces quisqualis]